MGPSFKCLVKLFLCSDWKIDFIHLFWLDDWSSHFCKFRSGLPDELWANFTLNISFLLLWIITAVSPFSLPVLSFSYSPPVIHSLPLRLCLSSFFSLSLSTPPFPPSFSSTFLLRLAATLSFYSYSFCQYFGSSISDKIKLQLPLFRAVFHFFSFLKSNYTKSTLHFNFHFGLLSQFISLTFFCISSKSFEHF